MRGAANGADLEGDLALDLESLPTSHPVPLPWRPRFEQTSAGPTQPVALVAEHTSAEVQKKYLGLRFPASDIPSQARTLYLTNKLRVLADVEASKDALVPPALPDGSLLDQSHCLLRGLSPQGYYFSPPVPPEDVHQVIERIEIRLSG